VGKLTAAAEAALVLQAPVKTQADFEHQKKEEYRKPVEHKKEFLADLPEREYRPPTPVSESPLVALKKKLLDEKLQKEQQELQELEQNTEKEVFSIGGHLPPAPGIRGAHKAPSARHGPVRQFSQAQIAEMNLGLKVSIGEIVKAKIEKGEMTMDKEQITNVAGGSLEAALKNAKEQMQIHKAAENSHHMEFLRFEKVVEALEQTVRLVNAPRADLKNLVSGNGDVKPTSQSGASRVNMKPRGFWKDRCREIVVTAPISLNNITLVQELMKNVPDATKFSAQAAMYGGLKEGWLYKDKQGFIRFKEGGANDSQ
jgi:hypothetical protein